MDGLLQKHLTYSSMCSDLIKCRYLVFGMKFFVLTIGRMKPELPIHSLSICKGSDEALSTRNVSKSEQGFGSIQQVCQSIKTLLILGADTGGTLY